MTYLKQGWPWILVLAGVASWSLLRIGALLAVSTIGLSIVLGVLAAHWLQRNANKWGGMAWEEVQAAMRQSRAGKKN
jgi:peptidoglycan/LPS O-acetylase OafA/YrhL